MKYLRWSPLALFTFVLGVAISPIHFYVDGIGCGRVIDGGGGFSVTSYTSSYFVKLSFAHSGYASPGKVNDVFNHRLDEAVKVIEVTPKVSRKGTIIGRRAVAIFFEPEVNRYYAAVFWSDGRILHSIYSSSMLHTLEFEKHDLGAYED